MKILVATGGTGGHFYPALALAAGLSSGGHKVVFAGRFAPRQKAVLKSLGYGLMEYPAGGLTRGNPVKALAGLLLLLVAFPVAIIQVLISRPGRCACFGGYAGFPAALACFLARVPIVLHEPNAIPGLAAKVIGWMSKKISLGIEPAAKYFPSGKVEITGTPVRGSILKIGAARRDTQSAAAAAPPVPAPRRPAKKILILGGSQGSRAINAAISNGIDGMISLRPSAEFVHITGDADFYGVDMAYSRGRFQSSVYRYLDEMESAYAGATLAVCRAGASTLAELAAAGVPAILIPYPYAAAGHQNANAQYYEKAGAAALLDEADIARLPGMMVALASDDACIAQMSVAMLSLSRPDAALRLAGLL